jgi:hypothetical protein
MLTAVSVAANPDPAPCGMPRISGTECHELCIVQISYRSGPKVAAV